MRKIFALVFFFILILLYPKSVNANQNLISCENRYVTLVNPVRGRSLWSDKSVKPLIDQYLVSSKYGVSTTWLLQYDALIDQEITNQIKNFEILGERGLFLEISKKLSVDSGVKFDDSVRWSHPGVVFLSGYTQSERRRLIDTLYREFKSVFGYYPKSIGAWWIDSYSLNYIKENYGLDTILIVADQKTTDSYGVWGQWWGYPYIPSTSNVLTPSSNKGLNAVVIQWAQRDPILAFGDNAQFSNFSVQANDYIRNGKNTEYFSNLVKTYLSCDNKIGQVTVGMETGMEAVEFHQEYINQLKALSGLGNLQFVTMSDFAKIYKDVYSKNPDQVTIGDWKLMVASRLNEPLNQKVKYSEKFAFQDYFIPDKLNFLNRVLPDINTQVSGTSKLWLYLAILSSFIYYLRHKRLKEWFFNSIFVLTSYVLVFRGVEKWGWSVYYGFAYDRIVIFQILIFITLLVFTFWALDKIHKYFKLNNKLLILLPLCYGIDGLLMGLRTSVIDGGRFLGLMIGNSKIFGFNFSSSLTNFRLDSISGEVTNYFYKLPYHKIYSDWRLNLIVFPVMHIITYVFIYLMLNRVGKKVQVVIILILCLFYILYINTLLIMDPVFVKLI